MITHSITLDTVNCCNVDIIGIAQYRNFRSHYMSLSKSKLEKGRGRTSSRLDYQKLYI